VENSDHIEILRALFLNWAPEKGIEILPLPQAGSYRQYYRITGQQKHAIGVYSPDKSETTAFLTFTNHFRQLGLQVPEIYASDPENDCYLVSDLGNMSLLDHLELNRTGGIPSDETYEYYRLAIAELPRFQVDACRDMNFSVCYPSGEFDGRAMRWDLNYFKYYFLRLLKIPFNEAALEDDFDRLIIHLLQSTAISRPAISWCTKENPGLSIIRAAGADRCSTTWLRCFFRLRHLCLIRSGRKCLAGISRI
jgi:hypothetical protein